MSASQRSAAAKWFDERLPGLARDRRQPRWNRARQVGHAGKRARRGEVLSPDRARPCDRSPRIPRRRAHEVPRARVLAAASLDLPFPRPRRPHDSGCLRARCARRREGLALAHSRRCGSVLRRGRGRRLARRDVSRARGAVRLGGDDRPGNARRALDGWPTQRGSVLVARSADLHEQHRCVAVRAVSRCACTGLARFTSSA